MLTILKIMIIILIIVCLALKTQVKVSITLEKQPYHPLKKVEYIERQVQQFTHLSRVDTLMVDEALCHTHIRMHKKHAKEKGVRE